MGIKQSGTTNDEGLRKVTNRRHSNHKNPTVSKTPTLITSNNFDILDDQLEEIETQNAKDQPPPKRKHQEPNPDQNQDPNQSRKNREPQGHSTSTTLTSQEVPLTTSNQDFDVVMDEDMSDLGLGYLNLLGMEESCQH